MRLLLVASGNAFRDLFGEVDASPGVEVNVAFFQGDAGQILEADAKMVAGFTRRRFPAS
jgi:hypothetical protein